MGHGYTVEDNLKLVMKIAHRYNNRIETTLEDIYQEGCIGLMRAVKEYDESKGVSFSAFAGQYITFYILNHLTKIDPIRRSRALIEITNKILKGGMRDMSTKEIADKLGISENMAEQALININEKMISTDMPISENNGKPLTINDILSESEADNYESVINECVINSDVYGVTKEDKRIISLIYKGYTRKEILEILDVKNYNALSAKINRIKEKYRNSRHLMKIWF